MECQNDQASGQVIAQRHRQWMRVEIADDQLWMSQSDISGRRMKLKRGIKQKINHSSNQSIKALMNERMRLIDFKWFNERRVNKWITMDGMWMIESRAVNEPQSMNQSIMTYKTRDERRHCVWSLHRRLPRRPGPRSHRTDWRNDQSLNQLINEWMSEWMNELMNEWMNEWTNEWINQSNKKWHATVNEWASNSKWNEMSDRLKMNERKLLGKPSMNTVENCSDGAAEKAELRASLSKTQRRRASEPMRWGWRRIPSSTHVTENTATERRKIKSWPHIKE